MEADDIRRAIWRMAHEVIERNQGVVDTVVIGLQTGGVALAEALATAMHDVGEEPDAPPVPLGTLDVAFYRDDIGLRPVLPEAVTDIPFDITGKYVVLVDDVLFTGRTIRAVLNELFDFGRPASVALAVLVDREGRELPIQADFAAARLQLAPAQKLSLQRGDDGRLAFIIREQG